MNDVKEPRYTSCVNGRWFPDMIGGVDSCGSSETYTGIFNYDITDLAIDGVEKYRFATKDSGWRPWTNKYDLNDTIGDGSPLIALEIKDSDVLYMVHTKGGQWSKPKYGNEEGFAGSMLPIDAVQILRM